MKVIIYNINQEDKKLLALANRKKHKITIITSPLDATTAYFADSKDVVITDHVSPEIITLLSSLHIKYLLFDSDELSPADISLIKNSGFTFIQIKSSDQKPKAYQIIEILNEWEKSDKDHSEKE
ncbi:hypothetical protein [Chryseobacterium wanjuense]